VNITYVITGLKMGGAEKQVCLLADKMSELGHDIVLVSLLDNPIVLPKQRNVRVYELGMKKNPLSIFVCYLKLCKIIKNNNPDVVHSHLFHANIMCRLTRLFVSIKKLICSAHSRHEGGRIRMMLYRITDFLANITTNVSQDAVDEAVKRRAVPKNKIKLVYNGIDTTSIKKIQNAKLTIYSELNLKEDVRLLLAVGRFTTAKDYPNLLHALKIINAENLSVHLIIAGHGELFDEVKELSKELKLNNNVHFLGLRHDIPLLISAADLFVLSSAWEGLPLVVGEAMACETFVVTTNCGGVGEILGDTGIIVPVKSPQPLAEGIKSALKMDENELSIHSFAARKRVDDIFSINNIVTKWIEIYH